MTILFATPVLPRDRRTGGEVASSSFIDAMRSSGHRVAVIGYSPAGVRGVPLAPARAPARRAAMSKPDLVGGRPCPAGLGPAVRKRAAPVILLAHNVEHEICDQAGAQEVGARGWLNRREAAMASRLPVVRRSGERIEALFAELTAASRR